jgi:N-acetyl-anhydromuramyl-L-alanine amidase AmpD
MRPIVAAALFLACSMAACVSPDPTPPVTSLCPTYKPRERRQPSAPRTTEAFHTPRRQPRDVPAWYPSSCRISRRWTHIVVHHSATATGGAGRFDKYHRQNNGWDELGYHFVIGNGTDTPDGYVETGTRWHKQKHGAHCKTRGNYFNEHGIGICLVGNFDKTRPTRRQMASLQQLIQFLCKKCGIPPERVTTHRDVTGRTRCPGRNFDLAMLRCSLTGPSVATSMP